jgi:AcrR family transcriptional regulator
VDLREQYYQELELIKEARIEHVLNIAKTVFNETTIHQTKIRTIAERAKIGEATFYRYFGDKTTLVKLVSLSYWEELTKQFYQYYTDVIKPKKSGYLKVEAFLHIFELLYKDHQEFIRFTDDYDNYIRDIEEKEGSFEALQISVKEMFVDLIKLGVDDGTIRNDISPKETYDIMSQMFMSTLQRMTVREGYLKIEDGLSVERCMIHYIKMFMKYIKA